VQDLETKPLPLIYLFFPFQSGISTTGDRDFGKPYYRYNWI